MPYILNSERNALACSPSANYPCTSGELNYCITKLLINYVHTEGLRYDTLNSIIGALESAKHEFQRRVVDPYEDMKQKQNGDVYDSLEEDTTIL